MTRAEFLAFLTRVVRDGLITERRAAELLLAFDNGTLNPEDLPEEEDDDLFIVIPFVIAALITLLRRLGYRANSERLIVPDAAKSGLKEALRTEFQLRSRALAAALERSGNVAAWQHGMAELIKLNLVENATVGAGRNLTTFELSQMTPMVDEQLAFLGRFADTVALRNITGNPMSFAAVAARAETYGRLGIAFSGFFEELSGDFGPGWVVEYIARDDRGTCSNCHAAQGVYLPMAGPMVAEICFGGMLCRCRREVRFDPVAYARLTGTIARAA